MCIRDRATTATSSTGGGEGHTHTTSTLQPSVTVHMWKRTA